jgi:uncharacterized protein (UPF0548 family)
VSAAGPPGLATLALTYPEVGATAHATLPSGYHHLDVTRVVGHGRTWFEEVARCLLSWQVQRRAGMSVAATGPVADGARAVLGLGLGPARLLAPVEVVDLVAEPDRVGFAYGTLEGHPELGEERFEVGLRPDGSVEARIRAFSRPGRWFTRVAGPFGRGLQRTMTTRYLDALTQRR